MQDLSMKDRSGAAPGSDACMLLSKAKRQYLLTSQISTHCLVTPQGRMMIACMVSTRPAPARPDQPVEAPTRKEGISVSVATFW